MDSIKNLLELINEQEVLIDQYRKDIISLKKEITNIETECIGHKLSKESYEEKLKILRLSLM